MADLDDLLQEAEQIRANIDKENTGYPRLQLTLNQIVEANKRKLAKTTNYMTSDANEINASILLANKGIDAPRLTQTIENLSAQSYLAGAQPQPSTAAGTPPVKRVMESVDRFTTIDQLRDVDLQSFLKTEKESALMSIIEETRQQTIQEIEESFAAYNELEWEKQKQKIMQELLGSYTPDLSVSSTTTSNVNISRMQSMRQGTSGSSAGRSIMNDIEMEFAKEIYNYNEKIINNEQPRPDLLSNLNNLVQKFQDKNIEDAWNMLNYMSQTNIIDDDQDVNSSTRMTDSKFDRDNSPQQQMFFVNQAITYLEICFRDLIQNTVNANLKQAKLGGAIGTLSLISGYLRLPQSEKYHKLSEEFFDNDQPVWATIYLCLRCGDIEAARNVALKTKKEDIATFLDEIIRDGLNNTQSPRGHLSINNENKLKLEYKSRIKRATDAFKRAIYCYLCRYSGDDDSVNEVMDNVDDFLWFKLNSIVFGQTANTQSNQPGTEILRFQDFQTKLSIDFGEKYFTKNRNPFTYLQVLLLTAQFEMAIEFLLKYETMIVHGVHMAIALYERKILNCIKTPSCSQLIVAGEANEQKCIRRVNFPSLIRMYTRKFECSDPREALQYYFFLRSMKTTITFNDTRRETNFFAQYIGELALETREFELLFGKLEKNAVRRQGYVDKFTNENETAEIIELVANEIETKGLIEEAIKLYDLCKKHQHVLELCNKLISQVVTEVNVSNSNRDRLKTLATSIAVRYKVETNMSSIAIPKSVITTFYLLTDLMTFFDLFHAENWDMAYETINKLGVLPITSSNVDSKVRDFVVYNEEVIINYIT
jgi:nuclear pore complex protein Nup93